MVHEVRATRHGPTPRLLPHRSSPPGASPLDETYALRWVGAEHGIRPSVLVDVANVTSFEGFREAARSLECPGQNLVYADVDGTIGYQCRPPSDPAVGDGTIPVPGWTDEHEWDGFVPFEELPWAVDPEGGYLVTANDRVQPEDATALLGLDFHAPDRAARIAELLDDVASTPWRRAARSRRTRRRSRRSGSSSARVGDDDRAAAPRMGPRPGRRIRGGGALGGARRRAGRRAVGGKEPLVAEYLTDRELFRCRALPLLLEQRARSRTRTSRRR